MNETERIETSKRVVHLMFGLTARLRAHMDDVAAAIDLTPMQARALFVTREPIPMGSLAETLHCDASNVTGIVDRLEALGLMGRQPDPQDRRRRRLVVTEAGTALTVRMQELMRQDHPILELDDDALSTLHDLLLRMGSADMIPPHVQPPVSRPPAP